MTDDSKHPEMGGADKHANGRSASDPGLVAEPVEPQGSSPALTFVQPYG